MNKYLFINKNKLKIYFKQIAIITDARHKKKCI